MMLSAIFNIFKKKDKMKSGPGKDKKQKKNK